MYWLFGDGEWAYATGVELVLVTHIFPDSKVHGANMGPTWVLSAPDGPHFGPMDLAIRVGVLNCAQTNIDEL